MSRTVGPSHRVCSSPTLVSAVTVDSITHGRVVAAPEPGLDDRDLDVVLRQRPERRRRQQLELRHVIVLVKRPIDALRRPRRACDGRRERVHRDVVLPHLHALGVGDEVRR